MVMTDKDQNTAVQGMCNFYDAFIVTLQYFRLERFLQLLDECEDSIPGDIEYYKNEILNTFDRLVEGGGVDVTYNENDEPVISRKKLVQSLILSNGSGIIIFDYLQ